MEHSAQNMNNVQHRGQRLLWCVEDRHHTDHMYTSLYIQTQNREHCATQGTGNIAQCRGQALDLLPAHNTLHTALCNAGDREYRAAQGKRRIVQHRGHGPQCSLSLIVTVTDVIVFSNSRLNMK